LSTLNPISFPHRIDPNNDVLDAKVAQLLTDNAEPIDMKSRTLTFIAIRPKLRMEKDDPKDVKLKTEREDRAHDFLRPLPDKEQLDPILIYVRIDKLEPRCTKSTTLRALPNRAKLRRETALPYCTNLITLMDWIEPTFKSPITLNPLPQRLNDLKLRLLPKFV
jgi:hypothetical protein